MAKYQDPLSQILADAAHQVFLVIKHRPGSNANAIVQSADDAATIKGDACLAFDLATQAKAAAHPNATDIGVYYQCIKALALSEKCPKALAAP